MDDTRSTAKRCHTVRSTSSSCVHIGTIRSQVSGLTVAIMSRHSIVGCACPRERQHFQLSEISHFFQILTALLIQRIIAFCHSGNDASTIAFCHSSLGTHEKRKTSLWRNSFHKSLSLFFVLNNCCLF